MKTGTKIFLACSGILLIALGVVCICNPAETLFASAWLIGLAVIFNGASYLVALAGVNKFERVVKEIVQ